MMSIVSPIKFATLRGYREAELYGPTEAHARSWSFGERADVGLRYAYRVGIDKFRASQARPRSHGGDAA